MAKEGNKIQWKVWEERFENLAYIGLFPLMLAAILNFVVDPIVAFIRGLLGVQQYSPILSDTLSSYFYMIVVLGTFLTFIAVILFGIAKIGYKLQG